MDIELELPTKNGDPVKMVPIDDDILVPAFFPNLKEKLESIRDMEYREGDVLICSYPKSGTHWVGGLIHKILTKKVEDSQRQKYEDGSTDLLELAPLELFTNMMSPRLIPTHMRPNRIPTFFQNGRAKVVLVLRNPKDVAVSFYYHLKNAQIIGNKQDWGEYFESFRTGVVPFRGCLDYLKSWEAEIKTNKALDIIYLYFEDMKTNGLENARRLAKHLEVDLDDTQLQEVLDACSLSKMKKQDKEKSTGDTTLAQKDGTSVIYRKGLVADWKNHFTVAQNETYNAMLKDTLSDSMFAFKYE